MGNIILTGDRPTGRLHIGHYVGSLRQRKEMQDKGDYDKFFIEIADAQALTDNYDNPQKIRENVLEVALDYLAIGIDPSKVTIFIQSAVPSLCELTFYYLNLVTLARLERNPTVKDELKSRSFENSIPTGFLTYPISQAADITGFDANLVPVGEDQEPMLEQTREIVRSFNLGNCIYLADEKEVVEKKVMSMYTDPDHVKVSDPGKVEGNTVFTYLDVFCKDEDFEKYLPEYKNLDELKDHYRRGGLGDVKIKRFLNDILQAELEPIRLRRKEWEKRIPEVYKILEEGTKKANEQCLMVTNKVKKAMGIDYFEDASFLDEFLNKYKGNE